MAPQSETRTVIVTGSTRGLGQRIAERFAETGDNVVICSRSLADCKQVVDEFEENGYDGTAHAVEVDVSEKSSVENLIDETVDRFGRLDVLVNNAGINIRGPAEEMSAADWQQVVDVNLTGVFFCAQAAGTQLIEQGDGGHIVNISSMMGQMGQQDRTPYNTTKGGVNNLTRCLAVEWAEHDIHVNALAPGYIMTEMVEQAQDDTGFDQQDIRDRTPLDRFGTPDEVANCVTFLASDDTFVTGEVLTADGGWTAFGWGCKDD
ncbi:SDR family NAD(P)-dependent oxidoreductase [Natrialba asiatica]|uniref:Short-chain dehydrogenase/reductase SDR n=1 Tax=Natrialba asiatica (strain ATCC 700177 / DSM 12278 / JCM 9576 / FERM P-10747 / NBRC 102637 / 172P1) TaxID=29540 RepID=M0AWD8_NATA1|nr:SDR family oxidoreductase [Natrialba asiatica]ELZ02632.1 short-chain dehydrogenase/reductase SDR [Natrialba asiatica DSM 12278]